MLEGKVVGTGSTPSSQSIPGYLPRENPMEELRPMLSIFIITMTTLELIILLQAASTLFVKGHNN